jgi:hypothetical protein
VSRITRERMTLGRGYYGRDPEPACSGTLTWVHTEFGRRTTGGRFRIVSALGRWQLLNETWDRWTDELFPTVVAAEQCAEGIAAKLRAARSTKGEV